MEVEFDRSTSFDRLTAVVWLQGRQIRRALQNEPSSILNLLLGTFKTGPSKTDNAQHFKKYSTVHPSFGATVIKITFSNYQLF